MRAPPFDLEHARRAARGVVRCTRAAFADRFVAAKAGGAAAAPAWNMLWPSCAAKPGNDREWRGSLPCSVEARPVRRGSVVIRELNSKTILEET
ncbi:MAG: hypothetical protein PPHEMADM_0916 [uncultured Paraburkholderia sp.]|nr:MAG: hypothetical protein PPHEMADE_1043 [uncultured Paraburkholderia sp.]CAH2912101.1 MAG: hypothetical protein PPHEMADM_0916 [uncultured Paraburkholderia sp.]